MITQLDDGRSDQLIYCVVGESSEWVWSEESGAIETSLSPGRLMGAFNAGVADGAWDDLPMPMLSNPRVRFRFTERGWRAYGLHAAAEARAIGRKSTSVSSGAGIRPSQWWYTGTAGKSHCYLTAISRGVPASADMT
jgi:hypothetical protein